MHNCLCYTCIQLATVGLFTSVSPQIHDFRTAVPTLGDRNFQLCYNLMELLLYLWSVIEMLLFTAWKYIDFHLGLLPFFPCPMLVCYPGFPSLTTTFCFLCCFMILLPLIPLSSCSILPSLCLLSDGCFICWCLLNVYSPGLYLPVAYWISLLGGSRNFHYF